MMQNRLSCSLTIIIAVVKTLFGLPQQIYPKNQHFYAFPIRLCNHIFAFYSTQVQADKSTPSLLSLLRGLCIILLFSTTMGWAQENYLEPAMVTIPAGEFLFGSPPEERQTFFAPPFEAKQRTTFLPAYAIGKYEVTVGEYALFINDGGYKTRAYWSTAGWQCKEKFGWAAPRTWDNRFYTRLKDLPVCAVSWYEAKAYCRWLAQQTGKPYRLPTEQEWEKAARGADGRTFPWGNNWNPTACNWLADEDGDRLPDGDVDGWPYTAPVSYYQKGISPHGCHGMAGNVMEWCADAFSHRGVMYRIYKGGSYYSGAPRFLRCAWKGGTRPELGEVFWGFVGFRVALGGEGFVDK